MNIFVGQFITKMFLQIIIYSSRNIYIFEYISCCILSIIQENWSGTAFEGLELDPQIYECTYKVQKIEAMKW